MRGQEFPRVDERLVGKRHRYGYAPAIGEGASGSDTLLKHDFVGGNTESRSFGAGKPWASSSSSRHPQMPRRAAKPANCTETGQNPLKAAKIVGTVRSTAQPDIIRYYR
jgi:Retinal pigment epithelial membrane protein